MLLRGSHCPVPRAAIAEWVLPTLQRLAPARAHGRAGLRCVLAVLERGRKVSSSLRLPAAIALLLVCAVCAVFGSSCHRGLAQWTGECVALLAGAGVSLAGAIALIAGESA